MIPGPQRAIWRRQDRDLAAEQPDRLPLPSQLPCPLAALRRLFLLLNDPDAPGFGPRARARHEPAKGKGGLGRVLAKRLGLMAPAAAERSDRVATGAQRAVR